MDLFAGAFFAFPLPLSLLLSLVLLLSLTIILRSSRVVRSYARSCVVRGGRSGRRCSRGILGSYVFQVKGDGEWHTIFVVGAIDRLVSVVEQEGGRAENECRNERANYYDAWVERWAGRLEAVITREEKHCAACVY